MKRIALLLLTALYLIPAIGVSVNVHWCGNTLQTVKVGLPSHDGCACGQQMPSGCCKNLHTYIKFNDVQKSAENIQTPLNSFIAHLESRVVESIDWPNYSLISVFDFSNYHAPPFKGKCPVYLSNRVFRV